MNLTERERIVLQLASQGMSDYKIARKINADPPNITRSRKNALRKLAMANSDLIWVSRLGPHLPQVKKNMIYDDIDFFNFFF